MSQRFPLQWPAGWPRAPYRATAKFNQKVNTGRGFAETREVTVPIALDRLDRELELIRASYVTLSSNLELRLDGRPRAERAAPDDPGAAVYFRLDGRDMALACDKWDRVADNITAIAKHIEALRGMDRWGVGTAAQAFAGYELLPAPEQWFEILGIAPTASAAEIEAAFRAKAKTAHPDAGGSDAAMARLNRAREDGRKAAQ